MKILKGLVLFLLLSSLILAVFSFTKINDLPSKEHLKDLVYQQPIQEEVDLSVKPFEIEKEGFFYKITPRYHYEILGISVADYSYDNWLDFFRRKDPLFKKDICLIWGYNAQSENYEEVSFKYRERDCIWETEKENLIFNNNEISMNHLLPSNEKIENLMKQAGVGDQVYIKGYLVNYQVIGLDTNFFVNSSSSRDDNRFEVIYVTDLKILAEANLGYKILYRMSKYVFLILLIIYIIIYFISVGKRPAIKKREVVTKLDTDPLRQKSFPAVFEDKD
ncbi:hypothetical protein AMJ47_02625 [Parcubacteria bacterium DG_72]|nr:MAG: hypothetical protein AMJ47_02625 [Parcubacteria bacterium DG_72]